MKFPLKEEECSSLERMAELVMLEEAVMMRWALLPSKAAQGVLCQV